MQTMLDVRKRLGALGYALTTFATDARGKQHTWKTFPLHTGGPTNYFDRKSDLVRYVLNVEQVREWQTNKPGNGGEIK